MQLEIEKDLLAGGGQFGRELEAAGVSELHADLIDRRAVADPLDETARLADVGRIEGDDQSFARLKSAQFTRPPPAWASSR